VRFVSNVRSLYSVLDVRFHENPSSGSRHGVEDIICSSSKVLVIIIPYCNENYSGWRE
jgi:hypothetical protein